MMIGVFVRITGSELNSPAGEATTQDWTQHQQRRKIRWNKGKPILTVFR